MEVERRKFGNSGKKITAHISLKEESPKDNQWDNKRKSDKIVYTNQFFLLFLEPILSFAYIYYTHSHINEDKHGIQVDKLWKYTIKSQEDDDASFLEEIYYLDICYNEVYSQDLHTHRVTKTSWLWLYSLAIHSSETRHVQNGKKKKKRSCQSPLASTLQVPSYTFLLFFFNF